VLALIGGAALWGGCSAGDGETQPSPSAANAPGADGALGTADDEGSDGDESEGEDEADAGDRTAKDAGTKKTDAGKKKDAGGSTASDAAPTPTPTVDAGKTDATVVVPACNTIPTTSATPVAITGSAPTLHGGSLVDGNYTLTTYERYISGTSGTTFPPIGMGVAIAGSTLQFAYGGGRSSYTFTASTNKLTLARTCPSAAAEQWFYEARGDTLVLYGVPPSGTTWYATFTRQP
jgi:hypothetical protein